MLVNPTKNKKYGDVKMKRKLLSVILVIGVFLTMFTLNAAAAEKEHMKNFTNGTLTINATYAGDKFDLFKVVDISYESATNSAKFDFNSDVKAYITAKSLSTTVSDYQGWSNDSAELKDFLGGFAAYARENGISPDYSILANSQKVATGNVAIGQYLVLPTGNETGAYVYQLMTASFKPDSNLEVNLTETVNSKGTEPTITKAVVDNDITVAAGDTVTYTVTVTIPAYPEKATNTTFKVTDILPQNFTFGSTLSAKVNGNDVEYSTLSPLGWEFDYEDALSSYINQQLVITYTATTPNTLAVDQDGYTNTAQLEYSNNPYGAGTHKLDSKKTVYTYGIEVEKVDAEDNSIKLAGVEFELYSSDDTLITTITTDSNGKASYEGLDLGDYYLVETKAPNGYNFDDTHINFTLADSDKNGVLNDDTNGILEKVISNSKGNFTLPQTGGIGTWVFTVVGVAVMAAAVVMLIVSSKKKKA